MHADQVNKTGHRRREEPKPPGSDSFYRAERVGEGWNADSERTVQLVLGDVGHDNNWGRNLRPLRE